jgi:hypothetical protein
METIRVSAAKYIVIAENGNATAQSAASMIAYACTQLKFRHTNKSRPIESHLRYSGGIAKNRFTDTPSDYREEVFELWRGGADPEFIREQALRCRNWNEFVDNVARGE